VPWSSRQSDSTDSSSTNVGKFSSNTKVDKDPNFAKAEVDFRMPLGITNEKVSEMISQRSTEFGGANFKMIASHDPNYTSAYSKIAEEIAFKIKELPNETLRKPIHRT
jgi:hypothetical protein